MYKVHAYIGNKRVVDYRMPHIPRCGDIVRLSDTRYVKVTEVVWCFDEESDEGQRVNIRLEKLEE